MGYRLAGTVTFEFSGYETDEIDPFEARHEVETLSVSALLDYMDDVVDVHVEEQQVT